MRKIHEQRKANDLIIAELLCDKNYKVTDDGKIWTLKDRAGWVTNKFRELGVVTLQGFKELNYTYKGVRYKFQAHRVVYAAKVGKLDPELNITHIDGNKLNNDPKNLTTANESESLLQRFGVYGNSAIRGNHKDDMKEKARALRRNGLSVKEIERKLGVARSSVSTWVRDIQLTAEQKARLTLKISNNGGNKKLV